MNYEERYNQALEAAKRELNYCGSLNSDAARQIFRLFPELKESEDERIRKDIISYLKSSTAISPKTWIAWLEKQGEQKSIDKVEPKWRKGNDGEFLYETSVVWVHNETKTLATAGLRLDSNTFYIPISELEKLPKEEAEEKPTSRIEPKFKVGDTIVEKDLDECGCGTIVNIKDGKYIFDDGCFIRIKEQEL